MSPSKSSLDRLPKLLSSRWEEHRAEFEEVLRAAIRAATTVAVSLDPMKDRGRRSEPQRGLRGVPPRDRPAIGKWVAARCHYAARGNG